jgi:hypothetical protein
MAITISRITTTEPTLSVVAATRNDDHGGSLLARTQLFIDGLAEQSARLKLPAELIVVEWNPPPDRPPLVQALSWPRSEWFDPNVITVPSSLHQALPHADGLPLFQMIAKNVGIRRARAPFVLATNIDILFSDELIEFLRADLKPNAVYRVDRCDILADLDKTPLPSPADCRALPTIRTHVSDRTEYPDGRQPPFLRRIASRLHATADAAVFGAIPALHTNAAGDFTLASQAVWSGIRGYAEWPMYSFYIDSLALVQAYQGGAEMISLRPPLLIQHLEHGAGSGWTPEGARRLFARLDAAGVPYLKSSEYPTLARKILRAEKRFYAFNDEDWGLGSQNLKVVKPGSPAYA